MVSKKQKLHALGVFISLMIVAIFFFSFFYRSALKEMLFSEGGGFVFIILTSALLDIVPQYIAPHILILNSQILGLGLWNVVFYVFIGVAIGSIFGFHLGRKFGFEVAQEWFGIEAVFKFERIFNSHGKWFVTLAAISPLPYVPLLFGSVGMKASRFYIYGMLPRLAGVILTGLFLQELSFLFG